MKERNSARLFRLVIQPSIEAIDLIVHERIHWIKEDRADTSLAFHARILVKTVQYR